MNKYRNRKVKTQEGTFDSQKEYQRWVELKLMARAKVITDLQRQVKFELTPSIRDKSGKVVLRASHYIADFTYVQNGEAVVEDVKGMKTPLYLQKKKDLAYRYGIIIKEI